MENLKVNARTSLDEFKRKHNYLVDVMIETYNVSSITSLTNSQIESLKCGDIVTKEDSSGKHAYVVTFKKDNVGICLTYADASVVETVSYDKSGNNWVYNSTDVMPLINVENAESGTIQNALGLNSSGKLVKGIIGGGTQFYKHTVSGSCTASDEQSYEFSGTIICTKSTELTPNELDSMLFNGKQYNPVSISILFGTGPFISYLTFDGNLVLVNTSEQNPIIVWYGFSSITLTNDNVVAL